MRNNLLHCVAENSATRMVLLVQLTQPLPRYMGVNLRGRQIAMTQQHLHHPQVGAMVEQMGSEGMAQGMG